MRTRLLLLALAAIAIAIPSQAQEGAPGASTERPALPPYTPRSAQEILEVQATVFLSAPHDFYQPSYLRPGEERTLDSSFAELRRGVDFVFEGASVEAARARMHELLDQSYAAYAAGDVDAGRMLILKFEDLVALTPEPPKAPLYAE